MLIKSLKSGNHYQFITLLWYVQPVGLVCYLTILYLSTTKIVQRKSTGKFTGS